MGRQVFGLFPGLEGVGQEVGSEPPCLRGVQVDTRYVIRHGADLYAYPPAAAMPGYQVLFGDPTLGPLLVDGPFRVAVEADRLPLVSEVRTDLLRCVHNFRGAGIEVTTVIVVWWYAC